MITADVIRRLVKDLPGAYEESSHGTPGFKTGGKLFARIHPDEDAVVILLRSIPARDRLIASDPDTYFITDHYRNYGAVLAAVSIDEDELRSLLVEAWRKVALKRDIKAYDG